MVNSNAKGKRAELAVANYLTREGIPARRHVRTGDRFTHDEGDIRLDTAPVTIEVKDHAHSWSAAAIAVLVGKLARQKRPDDLGFVIIKRAGYADPAMWACHMSGPDALSLLAGCRAGIVPGTNLTEPRKDAAHVLDAVGFTFSDVVRLLKSGGWVEQPINPFLTSKGV